MAKFTPTDILASYASIEALNANFQRIADLFEMVVSRDGTSPNSMLANLDCNHFKINNLGNAVALSDAVNYGQVLGLISGDSDILDIENPALPAASRAVLASMITTELPATLQEAGREGNFFFINEDLSAEVAEDTAQGIYVAPSSDPTGASGAWVRKGWIVKDPRWFGAVGDGVTDDTVAFAAAVHGGGIIGVPSGHDFKLGAGAIPIPSNTRIVGFGGRILFGSASGSQYTFVLGSNADPAPSDVENIALENINFYSDVDDEFIHIVRISNYSKVTKNFKFNGNTILYEPPAKTGGDRWAIAGSGEGVRTNFEINDNNVEGPMQLIATPGGSGTISHVEIKGNRLHNCSANPISILNAATIGKTATVTDFTIADNDISADPFGFGFTSVGIAIGVDSSSADQNLHLARISVINNRINITDSPSASMDILIRLGNEVSNIGGFDSTADSIIIDGNEMHFGITIDQTPNTLGTGLIQMTNFQMLNNTFLGGDIRLFHLGPGAVLQGNTATADSPLRLGANSGRIVSTHNKWATFTPADGNAEFEWRSTSDVYSGSDVAVNDQPFKLNANAGKVQVAYLNNPTIESISTGSKRGPVKTQGLGSATVHIRDLTTTTTWALTALYEHTATTGGIFDYNYLGTYTPTLTADNNCSGLTVNRAIYERNENFVRVSANISGTATAGATSTRFRIALPVASNFTANGDCIGTCASTSNAVDNGGYVQGDATNDAAQVGFLPTSSGAFTLAIQFQYWIK